MLSLVATFGLLASTAIAIPASSSKIKAQNTTHGLPPVVVNALGSLPIRLNSSHDAYTYLYGFATNLQQECNKGSPTTSISVTPMLDWRGRVVGYPNPKQITATTFKNHTAQTDMLGWPLSFSVAIEDVIIQYRGIGWKNSQSYEPDSLFSCLPSEWSSAALKCNDANEKETREFATLCGIYPVKIGVDQDDDSYDIEKRSIKDKSTHAAPNIFSSREQTAVTPVTDNVPKSDFAHGMCSFHDPLFQECVQAPNDGWNIQTLGLLNYIWDNNNQLIVRYPEHAVRIDGRVKLLTNIGDGLRVTFSDDGNAYFGYGDCVWSSQTKANKDACGYCDWDPWTSDALHCNEQAGVHYRASQMKCWFKC